MIREELLQHFVTVTIPGSTTDGYGNTVASYAEDDGATEQIVRGWVQQASTDERETTQGDRLLSSWLLITNQAIDGQDRITWAGDVYRVDGEPQPVYYRAGIHHWESRMVKVEG